MTELMSAHTGTRLLSLICGAVKSNEALILTKNSTRTIRVAAIGMIRFILTCVNCSCIQ